MHGPGAGGAGAQLLLCCQQFYNVHAVAVPQTVSVSDYLMDGWSRISEPPLSRASSRASFLDVPSLAGLDAGHGSQLQARGTSGS